MILKLSYYNYYKVRNACTNLTSGVGRQRHSDALRSIHMDGRGGWRLRLRATSGRLGYLQRATGLLIR